MGIFNIFKKNRAASKPLTTSQSIPQHCEVKDKQSIADFFNFDILHISREGYNKRIVLTTAELGMFPYVEVHSKEGYISSIEFISHSKRFSPEIAEFIKRCAATFGATKSGETILTQRDNTLLERGLFSRMWTPIWFECGPDDDNGGKTALRVTIFNPSTNGVINLKQV